MIDMNETQTKAFNIYIDSATMDNGFVPLSFLELDKLLKNDGLKSSKSSIGRWAVKFKWKELLEKKVSAAIVSDKEVQDLIEVSSINAATQKVIDDFLSNERLKSTSYTVLETQMMKYSDKLKNGFYLSHSEEKFVLKVLELTSTREDKLLDRQAILASSKLVNSKELLESMQNTTVVIEEPIDAIDLDIED